MNRRTLLFAATLCLASATGPSPAADTYQPDWESLKNYEVPEWYQDAKFGIWPHWGIYSVPEFRGDHAAEWYGRWMHCVDDGSGGERGPGFERRGLKFAQHHRKTYGDPSKFGYHDLIPKFRAENWDPDAWAKLAEDAGAKFFCMMGMHHDGFAMWDSEVTKWNAADMGPKRDLVGEMAKAARKRGLKFGISNHFAWNHEFFGFYHRNGFAKGQEHLADFYSRGIIDEAYIQRWWKRTTEVVDLYHPDLYYFDWGWNSPRTQWKDGNYHAKFAAHLYNNAIEAGKGKVGDPGAVLCAKKSDLPAESSIRDRERGRMPDIQPFVWQTDTSISKHSWGYATDDEYWNSDELIDMLIDIVSKNGVMMLNFGPKADGTVPEEYKTPLLNMGKWLAINGEAIYATRPWVIFGEGPELENPRQAHDHSLSCAGKHIRFTRNKQNTVLYATALDWPGETMTITKLAAGRLDPATIQSVRLLGSDTDLKWKQTATGLAITMSTMPTMPTKPATGHAYPVRIEFSGPIPALARPE